MRPRFKKLIGLAVFLPALGAYFLAAAALGEQIPHHQLLKAVYYLTAGIVWALPAKFLLKWMNAEPLSGQKPSDKT